MPNYPALVQRPEVAAFLDVIARGEVLPGLTRSEEYRQLVGGSLLDDLSHHPDRSVWIGSLGVHSTAAGRYQFLKGTWGEAASALNLSDFSPSSQDQAAVFLIRRRGVLDQLLDGDLDAVLEKTSYEWASLPAPDGGSRYGQWVPHGRADVFAFWRERVRHYGGTPPASSSTGSSSSSSAPVATATPRGPALLVAGVGLLALIGKMVSRYG